LAGRPSERLNAVADRLHATTIPMNLIDVDEIESASEIVDELDVLVHNAAISIPGPVAESHIKEWRDVRRQCLWPGGTYAGAAAGPATRSRSGGIDQLRCGASGFDGHGCVFGQPLATSSTVHPTAGFRRVAS
jgi:NAD(P)-dependent dehydrogenase (short-subunit alcohol dehydrogenase family)